MRKFDEEYEVAKASHLKVLADTKAATEKLFNEMVADGTLTQEEADKFRGSN